MSKRNYNRLPLDLPTPKSGSRRVPNRTGVGDRFNAEEDTSPLLAKIFVSIIIIILIIIIKNMDSDFSKTLIGHVRDGITKDMNIDETLGKLKFVSGYLGDVKTVFGVQNPQTPKNHDGAQDSQGTFQPSDGTGTEYNPIFTVPAEGKVRGIFGPDSSGIDIMGRDNPKVYAVSRGKVISIGEDDKGGKYIRIDHGNNLLSLYEGCSEVSVAIGDTPNKGDVIGIMGQDSSGSPWLHFEVWVDGRPVDPLKMIEGVNK